MKILLLFFICISDCLAEEPVIVWPRPDGGVTIAHIAWSEQKSKETTEAFLSRVIERNRAVHARLRDLPTLVVDLSEIPSDRYFRDAWELHDKAINPERNKCEAIHRTRLKAKADNLVQAELKEYQEADIRGDEATKGECRKKVATYRAAAAIDLGVEVAPTLEDLKSSVPSVLTTDK